jgi:hypothetical protein
MMQLFHGKRGRIPKREGPCHFQSWFVWNGGLVGAIIMAQRAPPGMLIMPARGFVIAFAVSLLVLLFGWATNHGLTQPGISAEDKAPARISLHHQMGQHIHFRAQ